MKVLELENLQREEGHIFYIRKYTCDAILELPTNTEKLPLKFIIEMDPLGNKSIDLIINHSINYPLIPLKKSLLEFILNQEREGKLPC